MSKQYKLVSSALELLSSNYDLCFFLKKQLLHSKPFLFVDISQCSAPRECHRKCYVLHHRHHYDRRHHHDHHHHRSSIRKVRICQRIMRSDQETMPSNRTHHHPDGPNQNNRCFAEKSLPKRIILVRHGESQGNLDTAAYTTIPDHKIPLTPYGVAQANHAGNRLYNIVSDSGPRNWRVYFYVSPYERTRATLREIGRGFAREKIIGVREECRVREQDFGNFQVTERMKIVKETRNKFGRFFYRFPEGESAADVFDRVSSFLESLWRDIDMNRLHQDSSYDVNLIIVSHGLTCRVFLMKWFKWTVDQFEQLNNLGNCELRVMQLGRSGEYSLAIHHSEEEMREWGLSPDMIADQKWRVSARRGWHENFPRYLHTFFDHLGGDDSDKECDDGADDEEEDGGDEGRR